MGWAGRISDCLAQMDKKVERVQKPVDGLEDCRMETILTIIQDSATKGEVTKAVANGIEKEMPVAAERRDGGWWAVTRIYPAVVMMGGDSSHPPFSLIHPRLNHIDRTVFSLGSLVPLHELSDFIGTWYI